MLVSQIKMLCTANAASRDKFVESLLLLGLNVVNYDSRIRGILVFTNGMEPMPARREVHSNVSSHRPRPDLMVIVLTCQNIYSPAQRLHNIS